MSTSNLRKTVFEASALIALCGLLIQFLTGAADYGSRGEKIQALEVKKLDREEYYRDIGEMKADVRVLRCQLAHDCVNGQPPTRTP
jgi:hypothetical protein